MDLAYGLTKERPLRVVPTWIIIVFCSALIVQLVWHGLQPRPVPRVEALPPAPAEKFLALASFGEEAALSRILMLWLQSFDYQPGISIPFKQLDYRRITAWLNSILSLDPRSQYPLLSAARLYSQVPDNAKRRMMLTFVYRKFLEDPDHRWPWLANAVYVAKYVMKDQALALKYARAIQTHVTPGVAPYWAEQMELFVLADMGRVESAKVLLGGLIASGEIKDKQQLKFLKKRLEDVEHKSHKPQANGSHKLQAKDSHK